MNAHQNCKVRLQQLIDTLLAEGHDHAFVLTALTELTMEALGREVETRKVI
jgi:hypothetical protein